MKRLLDLFIFETIVTILSHCMSCLQLEALPYRLSVLVKIELVAVVT